MSVPATPGAGPLGDAPALLRAAGDVGGRGERCRDARLPGGRRAHLRTLLRRAEVLPVLLEVSFEQMAA